MTKTTETAKMIRKSLKEMNVEASVRSEKYAGGCAVRISLKNTVDAETMKSLRALGDKFQYGNFNGMDDIYEYKPEVDFPRVQYVQIQKAW